MVVNILRIWLPLGHPVPQGAAFKSCFGLYGVFTTPPPEPDEAALLPLILSFFFATNNPNLILPHKFN
jgi:hypothetical protein